MTEVFKKQKHQNTGQVSGQGSSDGALQNNLVVQRVMDTLYQFITHTLKKKKCVIGVVFHRWDVLFASLRVSKLQKLEKGSILQVHNRVHPTLYNGSCPPSIKA